MSVLQTVNNLRGAMTYGDAQQALKQAYARLTEFPSERAAEAATDVALRRDDGSQRDRDEVP